MSWPTCWPAPAKINLFLHVTGKRSDGYHNLQTAFQFISLHDTLRFQILERNDIECDYSLPGLEPNDDLIVRAARKLQAHSRCRLGARIGLEKQVPMGGGLGGASSDAATTLIALNCLWGLRLSRAELLMVGASLGADVPVFIFGHSAWAEGIGERLEPIEPVELWYLVINPKVSVSTAQLFAHSELTPVDRQLKICAPDPGQLGNDFESLVRNQCGAVDAVFDWLGQYAQPFLTGTGSCVVAAFEDRSKAQSVADCCPTEFDPYVVQGYNRSPLLEYAN